MEKRGNEIASHEQKSATAAAATAKREIAHFPSPLF